MKVTVGTWAGITILIAALSYALDIWGDEETKALFVIGVAGVLGTVLLWALAKLVNTTSRKK